MKAILKTEINDFTNAALPKIHAGTLIIVTRLEDGRRKDIGADYLGTILLNGELVNFELTSKDFDPIA